MRTDGPAPVPVGSSINQSWIKGSRMIGKQTALIALAIFVPSLAAAVGLGPLEASSALNEPFDGRIELVGPLRVILIR